MLDPFRIFRMIDEQFRRDFSALWAKQQVRVFASITLILIFLYCILLSVVVGGLGLGDFLLYGSIPGLLWALFMGLSIFMFVYLIVWSVKQIIRKK